MEKLFKTLTYSTGPKRHYHHSTGVHTTRFEARDSFIKSENHSIQGCVGNRATTETKIKPDQICTGFNGPITQLLLGKPCCFAQYRCIYFRLNRLYLTDLNFCIAGEQIQLKSFTNDFHLLYISMAFHWFIHENCFLNNGKLKTWFLYLEKIIFKCGLENQTLFGSASLASYTKLTAMQHSLSIKQMALEVVFHSLKWNTPLIQQEPSGAEIKALFFAGSAHTWTLRL